MKNNRISILGGGSFGSAIAHVLAKSFNLQSSSSELSSSESLNKQLCGSQLSREQSYKISSEIYVWSRSGKMKNRCMKCEAEITKENILYSDNLVNAILFSDVIVIAVSVNAVRECMERIVCVLKENSLMNEMSKKHLVIASKGLTANGVLTDVICDVLNSKNASCESISMMAGANFAADMLICENCEDCSGNSENCEDSENGKYYELIDLMNSLYDMNENDDSNQPNKLDENSHESNGMNNSSYHDNNTSNSTDKSPSDFENFAKSGKRIFANICSVYYSDYLRFYLKKLYDSELGNIEVGDAKIGNSGTRESGSRESEKYNNDSSDDASDGLSDKPDILNELYEKLYKSYEFIQNNSDLSRYLANRLSSDIFLVKPYDTNDFNLTSSKNIFNDDLRDDFSDNACDDSDVSSEYSHNRHNRLDDFFNEVSDNKDNNLHKFFEYRNRSKNSTSSENSEKSQNSRNSTKSENLKYSASHTASISALFDIFSNPNIISCQMHSAMKNVYAIMSGFLYQSCSSKSFTNSTLVMFFKEMLNFIDSYVIFRCLELVFYEFCGEFSHELSDENVNDVNGTDNMNNACDVNDAIDENGASNACDDDVEERMHGLSDAITNAETSENSDRLDLMGLLNMMNIINIMDLFMDLLSLMDLMNLLDSSGNSTASMKIVKSSVMNRTRNSLKNSDSISFMSSMSYGCLSDFIATCTSENSRNYRFGKAIFDFILKKNLKKKSMQSEKSRANEECRKKNGYDFNDIERFFEGFSGKNGTVEGMNTITVIEKFMLKDVANFVEKIFAKGNFIQNDQCGDAMKNSDSKKNGDNERDNENPYFDIDDGYVYDRYVGDRDIQNKWDVMITKWGTMTIKDKQYIKKYCKMKVENLNNFKKMKFPVLKFLIKNIFKLKN